MMHPGYVAAADRYERCRYRFCGRSGLKLRRCRSVSGTTSATRRRSTRSAPCCAPPSISGITHFDLANNYGPPYGSAEINFGRLLREDFSRTATS